MSQNETKWWIKFRQKEQNRPFHSFLNNFERIFKKNFKENVLNFRPRVLNIQALDIARKAKGLITRPILYILKNIWNLLEKAGLFKSKPFKLFEHRRGLFSFFCFLCFFILLVFFLFLF